MFFPFSGIGCERVIRVYFDTRILSDADRLLFFSGFSLDQFIFIPETFQNATRLVVGVSVCVRERERER